MKSYLHGLLFRSYKGVVDTKLGFSFLKLVRCSCLVELLVDKHQQGIRDYELQGTFNIVVENRKLCVVSHSKRMM